MSAFCYPVIIYVFVVCAVPFWQQDTRGMSRLLDLLHGSYARSNARFHNLANYSVILPQQQSLLHHRKHATSQQCQGIYSLLSVC